MGLRGSGSRPTRVPEGCRLSLTVSELTPERVGQSGIETGGGAVEKTRERAREGAKGSFESVLTRLEGTASAIPTTLDGRVDVAAVIAEGRPVDQQREVIDNKQLKIGEGQQAETNETVDRLHGDAPSSPRTRSKSGSNEFGAPAVLTPVADGGSTQPGSGETGEAALRATRHEKVVSHAGPSAKDAGVASVAGADAARSGTGNAVGLAVSPKEPGRADMGGTAPARAVGSSGTIQAGASAGGTAGGGVSADGGRESLARLVGSSRGAAGGRAGESPFRMEQESPLAAQVSRGLAQVLKGKGGDVALRLRPEHLGEVRAHVRIEHGVVGVRVVASSDEARSLLERDVASLRAALESRGFEVESIKVEGPVRSTEPGHPARESDAQREDRAMRDEGGDRPADGNRSGEHEGAPGRSRWMERATGALGGRSPEAPVGSDLRGAYGVAGATRIGWDGVLRLDAVA